MQGRIATFTSATAQFDEAAFEGTDTDRTGDTVCLTGSSKCRRTLPVRRLYDEAVGQDQGETSFCLGLIRQFSWSPTLLVARMTVRTLYEEILQNEPEGVARFSWTKTRTQRANAAKTATTFADSTR